MRLLLCALALTLISCAAEPPMGCVVNRDCDDGEACVNGFCERSVDGGGTDGGPPPVDAEAPDSGLCGQPCDTEALCEVGTYDCASGTPVCVAAIAGSDVVCREAIGECDVAEFCDGTAPTCPGDAMLPASEVCREAASDCDATETCTGSSVLCPVDLPLPAGTDCEVGFCDGAGECVDTCTPGGGCSTGNPCEEGIIECEAGEPVCVASSVLADGESCGRSSVSGWSRCSGFADTCDETGVQSQTVTTPVCNGGVCVNQGRSTQRECERETSGLACDGGNSAQCHVCNGGTCNAWISCAPPTVCCETTNMCGCRGER